MITNYSSSSTTVEDQITNYGEDFVNHLPPGYRFHPTDDEIINYYLTEKIMNPSNFIARAIAEVDLNKCEPWDLPEKAKMGEKEWYFFCQRDRKYPTGMRTNRATEAGYWKATGKDREIISHGNMNNNNNINNNNIGMKKTLVFYQGRAPKGAKTNWVMHEYRLDAKLSNHNPNNKHEEWVVCRVFYKRTLITTTKSSNYLTSNQEEDDHKVNFNDLMVDFPALPTTSLTNSANLFSNTCIDNDPPPLIDNLMFNQHRLIQYQLPFTPDPLFHDTGHDTSGLTMMRLVRASSTYTNDINVKKESTSWYNGIINYDDDMSIVGGGGGGTILDSELDNLWNSSNY